MREWAILNGLIDLYEEYIEMCEEIAKECVVEGYPSHGSIYELRVTILEQSYPELFGDMF